MKEIELYKINETQTFRFYQMPKELFTNPYYKDKLSIEAKVTYSLLLDRLELSRINKWFNENGEIYLIYTRKELIKELKVGNATACKIFTELSKCNLIKEERLGQGLPNRIYIGKIKTENIEKVKSRIFRSSDEEFQEVLNRISRSSIQNTNDTELNNTNNSYIDSKTFFAEKVSLGNEELNNLLSQYGKEKTAKIIVTLDLYKKSTGKEYASDYNAILNWVVNKVEREEKKQLIENKRKHTYQNYSQREYDDLENFYDIGGN